METPPRIHAHATQRGAALIVSLAILLVMTLFGVTALKTTVLEERMAGNLRDQHLAFQATEAALRAGEQWTAANTADAQAETALNNPATWDGRPNTAAVTVDTQQLVSQPVFHAGPPQYARIGNELPPKFRCIYPITARGEGGSANAVSTLRVMFEPIGASCD